MRDLAVSNAGQQKLQILLMMYMVILWSLVHLQKFLEVEMEFFLL